MQAGTDLLAESRLMHGVCHHSKDLAQQAAVVRLAEASKEVLLLDEAQDEVVQQRKAGVRHVALGVAERPYYAVDE